MKWLLTWTLPLLLSCVSLACRLPFLNPPPRDTGGFFLVVAVKADEARLAESVEQTMNVFRRRCDQLGLYCKARRQEGKEPNRVELRVSGAKDEARAKSVLLAQGLELRAVVSPPHPSPIQQYPTRAAAEAAARDAGGDVLPYTEGTAEPDGGGQTFLVVERAPIVVGDDVRNAESLEIYDTYTVSFTLRPEGAVRFGQWTGENINRYLAVVLNGRVVTAPYIKSQITDQGQIDGNFTREHAQETALVLQTGNLPAPVELVEEGTYRP